jgi:hypothetical protein
VVEGVVSEGVVGAGVDAPGGEDGFAVEDGDEDIGDSGAPGVTSLLPASGPADEGSSNAHAVSQSPETRLA